jgi:predicted RNase H-like HicB family nuclease
MRSIPLKLLKTSDGDYIASSSETVGFFAMGDTREEVLVNAREGIALLLGIEEDAFAFEITEIEEEPI